MDHVLKIEQDWGNQQREAETMKLFKADSGMNIIGQGVEEEKLRQVFGAEYEKYLATTSRLLPFVRPSNRVK
jgi:hypothetical protein